MGAGTERQHIADPPPRQPLAKHDRVEPDASVAPGIDARNGDGERAHDEALASTRGALAPGIHVFDGDGARVHDEALASAPGLGVPDRPAHGIVQILRGAVHCSEWPIPAVRLPVWTNVIPLPRLRDRHATDHSDRG